MGSNRTPLFAVMASLTLISLGAHAGDLPRLQTRKLGRIRESLASFLRGFFP